MTLTGYQSLLMTSIPFVFILMGSFMLPLLAISLVLHPTNGIKYLPMQRKPLISPPPKPNLSFFSTLYPLMLLNQDPYLITILPALLLDPTLSTLYINMMLTPSLPVFMVFMGGAHHLILMYLIMPLSFMKTQLQQIPLL